VAVIAWGHVVDELSTEAGVGDEHVGFGCMQIGKQNPNVKLLFLADYLDQLSEARGELRLLFLGVEI